MWFEHGYIIFKMLLKQYTL